MNAGKFRVFMKLLFIAVCLIGLVSSTANAELLIGISFPSQGGDNDAPEIDESLLTLPKLHLQDSSWFGSENRIWSTTIEITTCTWNDIHYIYQNSVTNFVFPSFLSSFDPVNFEKSGLSFEDLTVPERLSAPSLSRSVSANGKPSSSADPDHSIPDSVPLVVPQPATNVLNLSLEQNTLQLDWPADHIGWNLQAQTNPGINSQWFPISGSSLTNHLDLTLDRANTSVFFRLIAP